MAPRLSRWTPAILLVLAGSTNSWAGPFPATLDLASLNGFGGFVVPGASPHDESGSAVSGAGDFNGDGIGDLLIGAPFAGSNDEGAAYVVFGGASMGASGSFDLSSLDGTNGFVLHAINSGDKCGAAVSCAGDVNGDGVDDILIGAPFATPSYDGEAYVVFGGAGVGSSGSFDLSTLDGTNGFALRNGNSHGRYSGSTIGAGDVNGDGIGDVIIGTPERLGILIDKIHSYVVFGKDTATEGDFDAVVNLWELDGADGFAINNGDFYDYHGHLITCAGDVNHDGYDDVLISSSGPGATKSYVVFGGATVGAGGPVELDSLDGMDGFRLSARGLVAGAGDVNDDGVDDFMIRTTIYFGASGIGSSGVVAFDGSNGAHLIGATARSIARAGDLNGDTIDDVIVGDAAATYDANAFAGTSYVVFGAADLGAGGDIDLTALDGSDGFALGGVDANDLSGSSVSAAGDVNGDNADDIIIGAPSASPAFAGESYIVFGRPPCPGDLTGDGATDVFDFTIFAAHFGQSVAPGTSGDLDGNGFVDVFDFAIFAADFGCSS